jgi:enoyl-CoA hydratase/carnithine racemase
MDFEHILVERSGEFVTITMNRPQRRNALSLQHMRELITAFAQVGDSDALGIVLAGNGPVFSAGHDFADVADADLSAVRSLLMTCTELMSLMQQVPQPVVARVHGLATAAGCQLVATADLAVASEDAGFAAPGGRGSAESKGIGKQALYAQIDLDQPKAYAYAVEVMAATSQLPDAREGMRAFLEKRKPQWRRGRPS